MMEGNLPRVPGERKTAGDYAERAHQLRGVGLANERIQQILLEEMEQDGFDASERETLLEAVHVLLATNTQEGTVQPDGNRAPAPQEHVTLPADVFQQLMERIRVLEERGNANPPPTGPKIGRGSTDPSHYGSAMPTIPMGPNGGHDRHRLPHVDAFKGDRREYPGWKFKMQSKIRVDGHLMGDVPAYIMSRLDDRAARIGLSYAQGADVSKPVTTDGFWEFLDLNFQDKLGEERARSALFTAQQRRTRLENFNAEFMRLAYEARESSNDENLKTLYRRALRPDLQAAMVSVTVPAQWTIGDLMARVLEIEENMYRARVLRPFPPSANRNRHPDAMDIDPQPQPPMRAHQARTARKGKSSALGRRATWADQKEMEKRRKDGTCYRCGTQGHLARDCALKPAQRPTQARAAKAAGVEDASEEGSDQNGGNDSEESEN